jgi:hypothetical protein
MHQQLWGYKVEEKLYLGGTRTKKVEYHWPIPTVFLKVINYAVKPSVFTYKTHGTVLRSVAREKVQGKWRRQTNKNSRNLKKVFPSPRNKISNVFRFTLHDMCLI